MKLKKTTTRRVRELTRAQRNLLGIFLEWLGEEDLVTVLHNGAITFNAVLTVDECKQLIELKDPNQRELQKESVAALAQDMLNGDFGWVADALTMSREGTVINANHRLNAAVRANMPLEIMVVCGVPDWMITVIDSGTSRSLSARARIGRIDGTTGVCSILQNISRVEAGNIKKRVTIPELARVVDEYNETVQTLFPLIKSDRSRTGDRLMTSPAWGVIAFMHRRDPEKVEDFARRLVENDGLRKYGPGHTLRKWMSRVKEAQTNGAETHRARVVYTARALEAHLRGKQLRELGSADAQDLRELNL
jgi:hypothetical protein